MATYLVDTSQVLSASTDADSIFVQSGSFGSSSIYGGDGADTIRAVEDLNNASSVPTLINGQAGNDSIVLASGTMSAGGPTVIGGAGDDTLFLSGGTISLAQMGDGADFISGGLLGMTVSSMTLGAGSDTVDFIGTVGEIKAGAGNDLVSGTFGMLTGTEIRLGAGDDTLRGVYSGQGANSSYSIVGGLGADIIDFVVTGNAAGGATGLIIKGNEASDTITVSSLADSAFLAGNAGDDSIVLSASFGSASTVAGGAGNDTIWIESGVNTAGFTGYINGGAGNDSILISDDLAASGADRSALYIDGGAGADTIAFSAGTQSGGSLLTLDLRGGLTESTISAGGFDLLQLTGTTTDESGSVVDVNVVFDTSATITAIGAASAATIFDDASSKATMDASGVVTFSGSTVASSVTAAAATVDTLTLAEGKGTIALFSTAGGDEFLFIQGGTTGTADDALIQIDGLSAAALSTASAAVIYFSGAES